MTEPLPNVVKDPATQQNFDHLSELFPLRALAPFTTTLPTKPVVGQQATFKAAENVYWSLTYLGEGTTPWVVSGPPLVASATESLNTSSATFQTTGQAALTTPLLMIANVEFTANAGSSGAGLNQLRIGLFNSATPIGSETGVANLAENANGPLRGAVYGTEIAKSSSLNVRYKSESGKSSTFFQQHLIVTPLRVG